MLQNKIKWALKEDKAVLGTGLVGFASAPVLRTLANSGVQWLFVDMEHSSIDVSDLLETVQFANALGMCSVPRIPSLEYHWVARALDTGSLSVMVPRIESAEQAELAVKWAKFPPLGIRGAGSPAHLSYAPVTWAEGVEIANRESMVVLQIESRKAVDNIESIASVPGVDAFLLGPLDMSISLGHPGDLDSEESHEQFRRVCHVARAHGVAVGIACSGDNARLYYEMGIRLFSIGNVLGHLRTGLQAAATRFWREIP